MENMGNFICDSGEISETNALHRILNRKQVEAITSYSRASIYRLMEVGDFPKSIKLGDSRMGWLESEIQAWIQSKIDGRKG